MKRILVWLAAAAMLLLGFALYRRLAPAGLGNVEPHAAQEIEKARRR